MKKKIKSIIACCFIVLFSCQDGDKSTETNFKNIIREVNEDEIPRGDKVIALLGATVIDGNGGAPLRNACVVIRNDKIEIVGKAADIVIPKEAEIMDVKGLTMLPGLIDAHYHNEGSSEMASIFLTRGVTSVRDPGEWIEAYDTLRASGQRLPRLFLAGPHIDSYPPAYPEDSYLVNSPEEARLAVEKFGRQGASVIKVYYRLSLEMIREICTVAHQLGIPVTAHLEIVNAKDAIEAGLDGIEHITSFGTCLVPLRMAEKYKQQVMADNNARKRGRYEVWNSLQLQNNVAVDSLIRFLSSKKTFVSPTLAIFEKQRGNSDSVEVNGFLNMMAFVGMAKKGGARMVVGSHTYVPYADPGFAYFREMELLQMSGMSNMEVILAATIENARFFRIDERLGSIEAGKIADLILVEGDPLKDIQVMRQVKRVMLNGKWVVGNKEITNYE